MEKKSIVVRAVVNEIESLVEHYEGKLVKKEQEIESLTDITHSMQEEIVMLKVEKQKLQSDMNKLMVKKYENIGNQQTLLYSFATSKHTILEDYLMDKPSKTKAIALLQYLAYAIDVENIDVIEAILGKLTRNIRILEYKTDDIGKLLRLVLNRLFNNENRFSAVDYDDSFILMLQFMMKLERTSMSFVVKRFIKESFDSLLDNIMYTNYLKIIIPFLRTCYMYELHDLLKKALRQIFEEDWEYLERDVDQRELFTIFWYAYLVQLDRSFFDAIAVEEASELEKKLEYELYFYVYDSKNELLIPTKQEYLEYKQAFHASKGLTLQEKNAVIKRTDEVIHPLCKENQQFKWPTTEINETSSSDVEFELKQESELKSFGYQITGLTRVERWGILEKAVPELGLYKVAHTIAHHVRMRKGHVNGEVKFKHALTQWEYDLDRLKAVYYKKDFRWPST